MRQWTLDIALDRTRAQPLYLQLAGALADAVRQGRLNVGAPLPGTRVLATHLGLNRNTVVAAYAELVAEGVLCARNGGGTFVAEAMPTPLRPRAIDIAVPTYSLPPEAPALLPTGALSPGMLTLAGGMPDARLFPARALSRAFHRALDRRGRALVAHADPCGHVRLREQLAAMLTRTRGLAVNAENLLVTHSIEQAIDLTARALIAPGDAVAVEAWGYPPAWNALRLAGARLLPVRIDENGLDVDALERLLAQQQLRAVFLTPHHQFPTAVVMTPERRARLGELSLRHRFVIFEDDYDHEFHYQGKPVLPIAAGNGRANVVYLGSLANLLAPGMHTAFVTAPTSAFRRIAALRAASDPRTDAAVECAIAELFEDGELERHLRRACRLYRSRRDALADALRRQLGGALDFRIPEGGLALWARADETIDLPAWIRAGESEGVCFVDARRFDFQQSDASSLRLGYGFHDEGELAEAVRRIARALKRAPLLRGSAQAA